MSSILFRMRMIFSTVLVSFEIDVYIKKLIIFLFSDFTPDVLANGVNVVVRNMSRLYSRSGFVCMSEDESLIDFVSSKISIWWLFDPFYFVNIRFIETLQAHLPHSISKYVNTALTKVIRNLWFFAHFPPFFGFLRMVSTGYFRSTNFRTGGFFE